MNRYWKVLLLAALAPAGADAQRRDQPVRVGFGYGLGPTYNRVEGLPISIGPIIETTNDNPFRFDGRVILRVNENLPAELDPVGFDIRTVKYFGENRMFAVGANGWSKLDWIEDRGLSSLESSLSAFFFHDDRLDYYNGQGFAVYGRYGPRDSPFSAVAAFSWEEQSPIQDVNVASILDNGADWRDQPLAADGVLRSVAGLVAYDTRPRNTNVPFNGWWARGQLTKGIGGDLAVPVHLDAGNTIVADAPVPDRELAAGEIDIRRYNDIGVMALNLRLAAGGSLKGGPLPPQFQHALGGDGTIPGARLLDLDCGARDERVAPIRATLATSFFPYYGCDRYALLQAELIGYFGFRIGGERTRSAFEGPGDFNINLVPQWALFVNAGKGWTEMDPTRYTARDEDFRYDVGAGVLFGDIGVYGAYPLNGEDKKVRFVLRLVRRI